MKDLLLLFKIRKRQPPGIRINTTVYLKDEGMNPTRLVIKQTGQSAAISKAHWTRVWTNLASPKRLENAGGAMSAYCAKAGNQGLTVCNCHSITPSIIQDWVHFHLVRKVILIGRTGFWLMDLWRQNVQSNIKKKTADDFWRFLPIWKEPFTGLEGRKKRWAIGKNCRAIDWQFAWCDILFLQVRWEQAWIGGIWESFLKEMGKENGAGFEGALAQKKKMVGGPCSLCKIVKTGSKKPNGWNLLGGIFRMSTTKGKKSSSLYWA